MVCAKRLEGGQVHIKVSQVEAIERLHVNFIEDQAFLDEARTRKVEPISHDER